MYYFIRARDWDEPLRKQFGESNEPHTLTGDEVVQAMLKHGRAEITRHATDPEVFFLEFQNDYD